MGHAGASGWPVANHVQTARVAARETAARSAATRVRGVRTRALALGSVSGAAAAVVAMPMLAASRTGMHARLVAASVPELVRVAQQFVKPAAEFAGMEALDAAAHAIAIEEMLGTLEAVHRG